MNLKYRIEEINQDFKNKNKGSDKKDALDLKEVVTMG